MVSQTDSTPAQGAAVVGEPSKHSWVVRDADKELKHNGEVKVKGVEKQAADGCILTES